jgi:hypothetical protein
MSCACQTAGLPLCGCCTGVTRLTPALIVNPSLLPAIGYRVGTYSSFMQTMLAGLSGSNVPALAGLRTRDSSDFSIAVVDAWSEVLDILTFYTERLANEAYLGTAVEGRSVFELAELVGYKPSPGVSASTVLVFTLSSSPGSPATVTIPASTRVQSVPGPGQQPQVFETSADLTATIAANAIPAATTQPAQLTAGGTSTWIAGNANNIQPGDALLFISAPGGNPAPGTAVALAYATTVQIDAASGNTLVNWDHGLPSALAGLAADVCVYVFRTKAALFGVAAPRPGIFPSHTLDNIPGHPTGTVTSSSDWHWVYEKGSRTINLDGAYPGLNPAATSPNGTPAQLQWVVLTGPSDTALFQIATASESNPALYALSNKTTQLTMTGSATPMAGVTSTDVDTLLETFVNQTRQTTVYVQSQLLTLADLPITTWSQSLTYPLTAGMLAPVSGKTLTLGGLQPLAPNMPVGVSGKRLRIAPTTTAATFTPTGAAGGFPVSVNQAFLVDAFPPTADPTSSNLLWSVLTVTGQAGTLSLAPGAFQLLPSAGADPVTGEAAIVSEADVEGITTELTFSAPLARIYDASTVAVNANAVAATHGETTQEILGSGDATNPSLQFQLKQSPLTYVSAPNASGVQSTLQVRVNNLLWTEVPNFLDSAPSDRAYVTQPQSTGSPVVQFGNGVQGSRTPTGQSNIVALYRTGIGLAGMMMPGQLTQALDRPQGLQAVTNPSAATGAADPASPADARQSAPLPTLTLGRVVSLEDYQNFALNIPGIALALATWTWFGNTRGVLLTVAGAGGTPLAASDQVVQNLQGALASCALEYVPVMVVSYVPVLFEVALQVKVNAPFYDPALVVPQVWQNLLAAFAFGQLAPAQGVAASRIIELAQQVPGVVAVNLTALNRSGDAVSLANFLCASGPQPTLQPPLGAEVLSLDPASQGNVVQWP